MKEVFAVDGPEDEDAENVVLKDDSALLGSLVPGAACGPLRLAPTDESINVGILAQFSTTSR